MIKGNYEVEVLVNGNSAKEYFHNGNVYIEGRDGSRYRIRVRNNGYSKIKAVVSVDGLSVLDGQPASLLGRGYIINGYSSLVIDGWRSSDDTVNEFFFTDNENSYSVRSENGGENLGIIGVSIVEEKNDYGLSRLLKEDPMVVKPPYYGDFNVSNPKVYSAVNLCSAGVSGSVNTVKNSVGTGWGKEKDSQVIKVGFNGKDYPSEVFEIRYDTMSGLRKRGVNVYKTPSYVDGPHAFPGEYCKPPVK